MHGLLRCDGQLVSDIRISGAGRQETTMITAIGVALSGTGGTYFAWGLALVVSCFCTDFSMTAAHGPVNRVHGFSFVGAQGGRLLHRMGSSRSNREPQELQQ